MNSVPMASESRKRKRSVDGDASPSACPSSSAPASVSEDAAQEESGDTKGDDDGPDNESRLAVVAPKCEPRSDGDAYYKNLYARGLDFRQLALEDADFAAVLKKSGQLDFTDPVAFLQLTKSTLKRDFGLDIELPADRLCPPIPNRHNYILWLKELLDSSSYDRPGGRLSGIDIGTGASCIYPLLGCTQRPWEFIATDLDEKSLSYAAENVKRNGLKHRIRLVQRRVPEDPLIPLDELGVDSVDFVMTNPPFYESAEEMDRLASSKMRPPDSACTGAPVEMICDGGEVRFVGRMLAESLRLRHRVRWYTAMLGKLSSLEILVDGLRATEGLAANFAVAEFVQGTKTRRWAVAWSFGAMRPSQAAARAIPRLYWKKILPFETEAWIGSVAGEDATAAADRLDQLMRSLDLLSWDWEKGTLTGVGRTRQNVWGRTWRRRTARELAGTQTDADAAAASKDAELPVFGFEVSVVVAGGKGTVFCKWREGHYRGIFTSICGFIKTKLKAWGKNSSRFLEAERIPGPTEVKFEDLDG
ncbi:hypothetical protein MAPG_01513 [Magnaporthiopsis poae ATCC 64411]|uniref:U6 small nuclear RNA (adenine-(43)-N(6))-methyltransferase n=1 Tax=Magnaporthiopsis poae (strain ATCC 64411 / 73-15) TaxID=644358 RepID=A0A0C4DNW6_MAGP6|nr:hypothetical protein MAPG_01513 [Magnaporthiopsis poae ATCC 64411]